MNTSRKHSVAAECPIDDKVQQLSLGEGENCQRYRENALYFKLTSNFELEYPAPSAQVDLY